MANDNGYTNIVATDEQGIVALLKLAFTYAIISDIDAYGYGNRWCYHSYADAKNALDEWAASAFKDEPKGWHRQPRTGRRRDENGNETINW